jgi:hypothetical protein
MIANAMFVREGDFEIEVLDLSRLASEYGRTIHTRKTCVSTARLAPQGFIFEARGEIPRAYSAKAPDLQCPRLVRLPSKTHRECGHPCSAAQCHKRRPPKKRA